MTDSSLRSRCALNGKGFSRLGRASTRGMLVALASFGAACSPVASPIEPVPTPVSPPPPAPTYTQIPLDNAVLHLVTIADPVAFPISVAVSETLIPLPATPLPVVVSGSADQGCTVARCAVAAINGGFFDPANGQTTSHLVVAGDIAGDPAQNPRLVGNPDLAPYLDQILNRSEFRRYRCTGSDGDAQPSYAITRHRAPVPAGCTLVAAVGAGPQLLPDLLAEPEAFVSYGPDGTLQRDALGLSRANARSAIGITATGGVVLAMVAQVPGQEASGIGLEELAEVLQQQGVVQALNLDGGSSASLVFADQTHYGRLDAAGEPIQRPVKSVIWVEGHR